MSSVLAVNDNLIEQFKQSMRRLSASVNLITTSDGDRRYGMAATAVCSVGINPPSLLISVNEKASMHAPLMRRKAFCVNVLREKHDSLVPDFSGRLKGEERFSTAEWLESAGGLPVLDKAQASICCEVVKFIPYSGHTITIGEVKEIQLFEEIEPLLYQNGGPARAVSL